MKKFLLSIFCCLMAVFAVQAQSYVKVTSAPADWSGEYLIVYEAGNVAFNGGLTTLDAVSNTIPVTIADNAIAATDVVNAAKFTINASGNILSASGYYIGQTSNANGLKSSTSTTYANTLSLNADGSVNVVSASAYLRYNAAKDQLRFRYYKSSSYTGQKAIALYKYTEGVGGETPDTPVVVAPDAPTLPADCNFDTEMTVEITGVADGAKAYYSLNNETDWVEGTSVTITETTTVYAKVVKDELSSKTVSATYTKNQPVTPPAEGEVVDVLTRATTGVTGTSYTAWSGITVTSSAVYAGQSAGGNDAIQIRTTNSNSGIVTTTSGGKAKKVVVEWQDNTSKGRTLQVYGNNNAYTSPNELYATAENDNQGELLGTIVCGTSTELVIEGDYKYIGLRSASGAMYLTSVEITWDNKKSETFTLNVTSAGWATLFLADDVIIPDGVMCYTVSSFSGNYVVLEEITTDVLPSETAAIVEAAEGDYLFESNGEKTAYAGTNYLKGTAANEYITEEAYVLSVVDGEVGLYKAAMNGGVFLNNANKAYLPASSVPNKTVEFYGFDWGGTTGIENIEGVAGNNFGEGAIYDLTGRKINSIAVTGIYIIDGKKVFIRK